VKRTTSIVRIGLGAMALVTAIVGTSSLAASASVSLKKPGAPANVCQYTSLQEGGLTEGDTGLAVKQAQCVLNYAYTNGHGDTVAVDGDFGPATFAVTKDFQRCVGITVDGIMGTQTWTQMDYWFNQPGYACG
jgi:peptidoglycan hydrolase-like protein with peptidoglycan-binding domain